MSRRAQLVLAAGAGSLVTLASHVVAYFVGCWITDHRSAR